MRLSLRSRSTAPLMSRVRVQPPAIASGSRITDRAAVGDPARERVDPRAVGLRASRPAGRVLPAVAAGDVVGDDHRDLAAPARRQRHAPGIAARWAARQPRRARDRREPLRVLASDLRRAAVRVDPELRPRAVSTRSARADGATTTANPIASSAPRRTMRRTLNCAPPGGIPERSKGTGCKPVGSAFAGSNPAPTTSDSPPRGAVDVTGERPELLGQDLVHGRRGSLTS